MRSSIIAMWITAGVLFLSGCSSWPTAPDRHIRLSIQAPYADSVTFACSRYDFEPMPAMRESDSKWSVEVPGDREFTYFFIVDGTVTLPDCQAREMDDFGDISCLFLKNP